MKFDDARLVVVFPLVGMVASFSNSFDVTGNEDPFSSGFEQIDTS